MGGKKAQQCKAKNLAKKQNDLVRRQRSELEEKNSSSAIQVQSREARAVTSKAKLGKQSGIVVAACMIKQTDYEMQHVRIQKFSPRCIR